MFHATKTTPTRVGCNSAPPHHTKECGGCGKRAKSNSAISCWSCSKKYIKHTKAIKTSDGRGRVCKRCSKCGEHAKSNRASSCVHGCIDPFPKKAPGSKKAKKRKKATRAPKKVKKRKLQRDISDDLFSFLDEPLAPISSAATLAIFGMAEGPKDHTGPQKMAPSPVKAASPTKVPSLVVSQSLDLSRQTSLDLVSDDMASRTPFDTVDSLFDEFADGSDTVFEFGV